MIKKIVLYFIFFFLLYFWGYPDEFEKYKLSLSFYGDGFFEHAENSLKEFIKEYPDSIYYKKALFYLALSQINLKKYNDSIKNLLFLSKDKNFEYYNDSIYYLSINYFIIEDFNNSEFFSKIFLTNYTKNDKKKEKILYISIINNTNLKSIDYALTLSKEYFDTVEFKLYRYDIEKYLSNYFIENKLYSKALQVYEIMLIEKHNIPDSEKKAINHNYILCLSMLEKNSDAINFFNNNIIYYDKDIYRIIGDLYLKEKNYHKAIDIFERIYENSKDREILYKIGAIYIEQKDYKNAIKIFEKRKEDFFEVLGELYYKIGASDKSYSYLLLIDNDNLNNINFVLKFKLALEAKDSKNIKEFYNNLEKIKSLPDSDKNAILYKLGEFFYNEKDYKKADKILALWLNYFPNDINYTKVLYMRGVILKKEGNFRGAIVEFTKIQKFKKNDEVYYESLVEKGESLFKLREYHSAIECYKVYLNNKNYLKREKEVMLQLGNALYNIKRYKDAYNIYSSWAKKWGEKEDILNKIANSLLKLEDYDEIINYYRGKENIGELSEYLIFYANYKKNNFLEVIDIFKNYNNMKSEYYIDIAYLSLLSRFQSNNYENFKKEVEKVINNLKNYKDLSKLNSLYKEYFKLFVRINDLNSAYGLFDSPDNETIFYMGEILKKYLYFQESSLFFNKIIANEYFKQLSEKEILNIIDSFIKINDIEKVKFLFEFLFFKYGIKKEYVIKYVSFAIITNNKELLDLLNFSINDKFVYDYITLTKEYLSNKNIDIYIKGLRTIFNSIKKNDLLGLDILLEIVRMEYSRRNYKEVINLISKIPEKKLLDTTPEFRFLMSYSYYMLKEEDKAIEEFLKIYYLYSYDYYWVNEAIKAILKIYEKNNDIEKFSKVKKLFEEKFFKLR